MFFKSECPKAVRSDRLRLLLVFGAGALLAACQPSPEDDAAEIERQIMEAPGAAQLWQTIRAEYPDDLANLVSQIQALDRDERRDDAKVEEIVGEWLKQFLDRITPDAVVAPPAQMLLWSGAEHALYAALQRTAVSECAAMTMGQWILIGGNNTAATTAITVRNTAMISAAAAGRDDPHDYAEPSEAQFKQLGDQIAATGIAPELQAKLGSEPEMQALGPDQQCALGVAVYAGVSALPDDIEPELAAYMLSPA